jgi:hypothetical protein
MLRKIDLSKKFSYYILVVRSLLLDLYGLNGPNLSNILTQKSIQTNEIFY